MDGGGFLHQATHLGGAGERHEVDAGVPRQRSAGLLAEAGDDVQRTGGEPGLDRQCAQLQADQAGLLGRLEHHAVAHGQRRRHGAPEHLRRIIPGRDVRCHAQGLAHHADVVAIQVRNDLAMNLVGRAAVELEVTGHRAYVGAGL